MLTILLPLLYLDLYNRGVKQIMGHTESLIHFATIRADDDTADKKKESRKENNLWEENEYDESWDHIYDYNEFENKRRRLNRSDKYRYNKQD